MNNLLPLPANTGPERGAEILGRIRTAFAEKGFDGASMQDLARAAGMSVGNFYRYFPSKDAIVEAMVGYDMAEMERDFAAILESADPLTGIRAKICERLNGGCAEDGRLWAEITAAAHRKPQIARICGQMEELVARLRAVCRRSAGVVQQRLRLHQGEVEADLACRAVWRHGQRVELTAREWALLEALLLRAGRIVAKADLEPG